nr:T9SS type A sorting domain-containing protein [Candidatus Kapabacteria bacterium]
QSYQYTLSTYNIDPEKIVITGFSWGGAIAYELGLGNPEMFNGIIGLAPAVGSFSEDMWANIKSIRMATILGDKDINFSAVNALMTSVSTQGGEILYKIKPGVVHVDNVYFNSQEFLDDYSECWEFVLNTGTSVQEQTPTVLAKLSIYPNPATDYIVVENLRDSEVKSIELFDVTGRLVKTFDSEDETNDVSDLDSGFYVVKVTTLEGVTTKKIIVE